MRDFLCGIDFARAVVAHFALPPDTHADMSVNCGPDKCFSITVTIPLTADDLAAIADRMEGRILSAPPPAPPEPLPRRTINWYGAETKESKMATIEWRIRNTKAPPVPPSR